MTVRSITGTTGSWCSAASRIEPPLETQIENAPARRCAYNTRERNTGGGAVVRDVVRTSRRLHGAGSTPQGMAT